MTPEVQIEDTTHSARHEPLTHWWHLRYRSKTPHIQINMNL